MESKRFVWIRLAGICVVLSGCTSGNADDPVSFGTGGQSTTTPQETGDDPASGSGSSTASSSAESTGVTDPSTSGTGDGQSVETDGGESTGALEPVTDCGDANISTSALGWVAGEDVSEPLGMLLASLQVGDVVCLEELYDVRPQGQPFQVPDGVTLTAQAGAGLRVLDVVEIPQQGMFNLGNDVTLSNLTVVDEGELFGDCSGSRFAVEFVSGYFRDLRGGAREVWS